MLDFYSSKRILITGHTGFKGTWLSNILVNAGAEVTGYSLCREKEIDFYKLSGVENSMRSIRGDVRDFDHLNRVIHDFKPDVVIHMAAQPIVRASYDNPVETYSTNVMGTVNILEAVRLSDSVSSFLNVTTDKVYLNNESNNAFVEDEPLDGYDPYSNSKSCSEIITHSYASSFLNSKGIAVSTARAGNVIGGGDFSRDRIIPDCVRSCIKGETIAVRNPYSTRPYQHVLDPLFAYLLIAEGSHPGWYNVGPDDSNCLSTGDIADLFVKYWGDSAKWENISDNGPHEAGFLKLDSSKMKRTFSWNPKWNIDISVKKAVEWYKAWADGEDIKKCIDEQIREFTL